MPISLFLKTFDPLGVHFNYCGGEGGVVIFYPKCKKYYMKSIITFKAKFCTSIQYKCKMYFTENMHSWSSITFP